MSIKSNICGSKNLTMKKIFTLVIILSISYSVNAQTYHLLSGGSLSQNWNTTTLLTTNDDWSGIPSIRGFRGDNLTATTAIDPQTVTAADDPGVLDLNANQTDPNVFNTGGVTEFEIANPTIALTGSGTADAPYIQLYLNTTGVSNAYLTFAARDLETTADDAIQQIAVQYRVGTSGTWTNIPAGFINDASVANATMNTVKWDIALPAGALNQAQVQVRIMTTNALGNDEWIGIDDIVVSTSLLPLSLLSFSATLSDGKVNVNWTTANEVNVAGYEVQRSVNGKDFMPISMMQAENAGSTKSYSYVDTKTVGGVSYYRLKMNDQNGSYKYSQIATIKTSVIGVSVYPNPVRSALTIQHESADKGATVSILGINGKQLLTVNVQQGAAQTTIDAAKLAPGSYMVVYVNNGQRQSKQFIKE